MLSGGVAMFFVFMGDQRSWERVARTKRGVEESSQSQTTTIVSAFHAMKIGSSGAGQNLMRMLPVARRGRVLLQRELVRESQR